VHRSEIQLIDTVCGILLLRVPVSDEMKRALERPHD
jgi:hypothetical protein